VATPDERRRRTLEGDEVPPLGAHEPRSSAEAWLPDGSPHRFVEGWDRELQRTRSRWLARILRSECHEAAVASHDEHVGAREPEAVRIAANPEDPLPSPQVVGREVLLTRSREERVAEDRHVRQGSP